jgi:hypothetical protein
MPSQTPETPWPSAAKVRETGPGPLRTARGAGRFERAVFFWAGFWPDFWAGLRLLVLVPDDRDRELEPPLRDVLLLRDAGGEDVRVAMLRNVRDFPTGPMRHTRRGARGFAGAVRQYSRR